MNHPLQIAVWALMAIAAVTAVATLFSFLSLKRLWLKAFLHGAPVSLMSIVMMQLRGSPVRLLIDALIQLKHQNVNATIADVERTYWAAGGQVSAGDDLVERVKASKAE